MPQFSIYRLYFVNRGRGSYGTSGLRHNRPTKEGHDRIDGAHPQRHGDRPAVRVAGAMERLLLVP